MRAFHLGLAVVLSFLVLCLVQAGPVAAQSGGTGMGRLAGFLPATGQDDGWRYTNNGDGFEIANTGNPQAITYFYVGPEPDTEGRRRVDVELELHPDSAGSAGVLYGLNERRDRYHMITLDARGTVRVFRRDGDGVRPLVEMSSDAFRQGTANRLTVAEDGDGITYLLNGTSLGSLGGDLFGHGSVGIAAEGDVQARFTAFSDAAASPQPGAANQTTTGAGAETTGAAALPEDGLEMRRVQILDSNGPTGQGVLAYETLVPAGWDTQGGVQWSHSDGQGGCFTGAALMWGAGTQDQAYGLAYMNPLSWGVSSYGPVSYMCLGQDLTDAEMAARAYFPAISPLMQVTIQNVDRPLELKPLVELIEQQWRASWPETAKAWADGVVIRAHVRTQQRENDAYFVVITKHAEANYDGAIFRDGRTALVMGVFTPVGKLDEGHPGFAPILNNLRVNPQWKQLERQWWATRLRQPRPAGGGGVAGADTSIGDMMFESWKRREGMKDAGHAKSVNGIWEVQPWQTPSGGTVLLNQNYDYAWELQNGAIILTNNANFNPMEAYNQTGQQMQRN